MIGKICCRVAVLPCCRTRKTVDGHLLFNIIYILTKTHTGGSKINLGDAKCHTSSRIQLPMRPFPRASTSTAENAASVISDGTRNACPGLLKAYVQACKPSP